MRIRLIVNHITQALARRGFQRPLPPYAPGTRGSSLQSEWSLSPLMHSERPTSRSMREAGSDEKARGSFCSVAGSHMLTHLLSIENVWNT